MKTKFASILIVLALAANGFAQEVTREDQLKLRAMVVQMPLANLQGIDALCPTNKHAANIYFFKQITAASNTAAFLALSNTIATHR